MAYTNDNMFKSVDWITIVIYLALVVLGWFSICGACYDYGSMDLFSFDTNSGKQLVWIGGALGLGFIILMLEDAIYDWFAYIFYALMMLLLFKRFEKTMSEGECYVTVARFKGTAPKKLPCLQ